MNRREFLSQLRKRLSGLPRDDIEERLAFYSEMIEDRMEDGLSEEEAVAAVGSLDDIVPQVVADIPLAKIAKERIRPKRRLRAGEIVLLVLGSPIWLSLLMAACAVLLALYVVLWSLVVAVWAICASAVGCALGGVLAWVVFTVGGHGAAGAAVLAAGMVCAGLSIFLFYGCRAASKGVVILTKKVAIWVKNRLIRKEEAA